MSKQKSTDWIRLLLSFLLGMVASALLVTGLAVAWASGGALLVTGLPVELVATESAVLVLGLVLVLSGLVVVLGGTVWADTEQEYVAFWAGFIIGGIIIIVLFASGTLTLPKVPISSQMQNVTMTSPATTTINLTSLYPFNLSCSEIAMGIVNVARYGGSYRAVDNATNSTIYLSNIYNLEIIQSWLQIYAGKGCYNQNVTS